ncbi:unnamed protein product [Trichobilharzia regenti]|nr:unnamed protein product [Trichobilharzia regenti]
MIVLPNSVESNYEAFRKAYEEAVNLLYTCVNDLTGMHDFLAVSDDLMMMEYQKSIRALSVSFFGDVIHKNYYKKFL